MAMQVIVHRTLFAPKKMYKRKCYNETKGEKRRGSDKQMIITCVHTVERELLRVELVEKPSD